MFYLCFDLLFILYINPHLELFSTKRVAVHYGITFYTVCFRWKCYLCCCLNRVFQIVHFIISLGCFEDSKALQRHFISLHYVTGGPEDFLPVVLTSMSPDEQTMVEIHCSAEATPQALVYWIKDGDRLKLGPNTRSVQTQLSCLFLIWMSLQTSTPTPALPSTLSATKLWTLHCWVWIHSRLSLALIDLDLSEVYTTGKTWSMQTKLYVDF